MRDKFTLRIRDKRLYVVGEYVAHDRPARKHLWWPVANPPELHLWNLTLEQVDGQPLTIVNRGGAREWFEIIDKAFPNLRFVLPLQGQTQAEIIENTPIPCPKVRTGIETRWNSRYEFWEKYLKAKGWVRI